jgi:GTP 3',8-cyclase
MLKDSFGRIHDYLRVSLTDRCNFRCLYCLPEAESHRYGVEKMSADEIVAISKVFVGLGIKKIRLTGGEPLVRKDAGIIMEQLGSLGIKLALTTNGSRIDEFIDSFLRSGIRSVNVSLDSLDPANFSRLTQKDEFSKIKSNINLLLQHNFHVKINMVVMNGYNDHELNAFVEWTRVTPVHIRFIEFMPFPGNRWKPGKVIKYGEMLSQISTKYNDIEKMEDGPHDTTKKYRIKNFAGTFSVISTMSEPFCSGCNRLRLTSDGKLRNCLFSKSETDILTAFRNGVDISKLIAENLQAKNFQLGGNSGGDWGIAETVPGKRTMMGIGG